MHVVYDWECIDPQIGKELCVIPIRAEDALAWSSGRIGDVFLFRNASPDKPEAVCIVTLPDRKSYRQCLKLCKYWRQLGAVCLIARTGNPVVDKHLSEKNGCIRGFREHDGKYRFLAPPDVFARWCGKWGMQSPSPLKQNAPQAKPARSRKP